MFNRSATRRASWASSAVQHPFLCWARWMIGSVAWGPRSIAAGGRSGCRSALGWAGWNRASRSAGGVGLAVAHEDADHVVPRGAQQFGGDTAVDPTGHG